MLVCFSLTLFVNRGIVLRRQSIQIPEIATKWKVSDDFMELRLP
jgi:hypothetical protein